MKNIVFYAGSFDPFTNGHLHLVKKASSMFDGVIIGIGTNCDKIRRFDRCKMKIAIEETLKEEKLLNTNVMIYDSDTWKAAISNGSNILVRGLRNETDYCYEEEIAKYNDGYGIDTIYLRADKFGDISSSFVYDKYVKGEDISTYIPNKVKKLIFD